jgi:hypothetical protein
MKKTMFGITLVLGLGLACGGDDVALDSSAPEVDIELGQAQPDVPICSRCNLVMGLAGVNDDDELNIVIDAQFEGSITDVELTTYDSSSVATDLTLDSWVVDDLNDSSTNITTVYVDVPDAVQAELTFTHASGVQTDSIYVF